MFVCTCTALLIMFKTYMNAFIQNFVICLFYIIIYHHVLFIINSHSFFVINNMCFECLCVRTNVCHFEQ